VFGSRATSGPRDARHALKRPWRRPDWCRVGAPFARSRRSPDCPPTIVGCRSYNPSRHRTVSRAPEGPFFHAGQREPRAEYRACSDGSPFSLLTRCDGARRYVRSAAPRPVCAPPVAAIARLEISPRTLALCALPLDAAASTDAVQRHLSVAARSPPRYARKQIAAHSPSTRSSITRRVLNAALMTCASSGAKPLTTR
jgi:hypothetical protein